MLGRKFFRTAWGYKAQFLSMVLMMLLGVGVFVGYNMEWKTLEEDTNLFFEQTNFADYRLYSESGFSEDEISEIQQIDGVEQATRFLSVNAAVKDTKKSLCLNVSEDYTVSTMYLMEGEEYDPESEGFWLSDRYAEENDLAIGDTITLTYQNITFSGKIVGLIKSSENMICTADAMQVMPDFENSGFAYMSPKKLEEVFGAAYYPQINVLSDLEKEDLEEAVHDATGTTFLVVPKDDQTSYAGTQSEVEEGQTMGNVLPVLFLAIAILTMITTMHRIAAKEKIQIGTLKALGFKDRRILLHYTSYGFVIGLIGTALGIFVGYGIAYYVMNPSGMMATYIDMPSWDLVMPAFIWPILVLTVALLTLISFLSVKRMLRGTAADALRPYSPKAMRQTALEKREIWQRFSFGTRWNLRDILRHKSRCAMTLLGVIGCMVLLVGGLGMSDTMDAFMHDLSEDVCNYGVRIDLTEEADNEYAKELTERVDGDWVAQSSISYNGETTVLEVYQDDHESVRFLSEENEEFVLPDDGVYLCLRLKDTAKIGDTITFSPYGSEETFTVKVAGYQRSLISENIVMSAAYADKVGIPYQITSVFSNQSAQEIETSDLISGVQNKQAILDTYDGFMAILEVSVTMLILAALILATVVLYNLGVMSYLERRCELATLKVLGFRDRRIGRLLISQNIWLTVLGAVIGLFCGIGVLEYLIVALANGYELELTLGPLTYCVSFLLTFGVSLLVSWLVSRKSRKIDMVEALKGAE